MGATSRSRMRARMCTWVVAVLVVWVPLASATFSFDSSAAGACENGAVVTLTDGAGTVLTASVF